VLELISTMLIGVVVAAMARRPAHVASGMGARSMA